MTTPSPALSVALEHGEKIGRSPGSKDLGKLVTVSGNRQLPLEQKALRTQVQAERRGTGGAYGANGNFAGGVRGGLIDIGSIVGMEFFDPNSQIDEMRALVEEGHMLPVHGVGKTMRETAPTRLDLPGMGGRGWADMLS